MCRVTEQYLTEEKRPVDTQRQILGLIRAGARIEEACRKLGVDPSTFRTWRNRYPDFLEEAERAKAIGAQARDQMVRLENVYDPEQFRGKEVPGIVEFRRDFIGRPTPWHQQLVVDAWEDQTNQFVVCLMPPEAGKDTLAGDIALRESIDRDLRISWVMESANFSARRLNRLERYYWDQRAYTAPRGPGCVKPIKTVFGEYGQFKWEKGLAYPDGEKVAQPKWTQNELYFLGRDNEADPNLWATGVDGAMYGARIDRGIVSDPFTQENQQSPTMRAAQMGWITGTFLSRFGDEGRGLFLGTRVAEWDNWGKLIDMLVAGSPIISQDQFTTKYASGVAVVIVPAILYDENGEEKSFWPERFALDSHLAKGGSKVPLDGLSGEEIKDYAKKGYRTVTGLRGLRNRLGTRFETMYQQNPASSTGGEFPLDLLNRCDDYTRTFGQFKPGSTLILGIDPAFRGGAAWVLWEWNGQTLTAIDFYFGKDIGLTGLRELLLVDPITKYHPRYAVYETNRENSVLEHPEVLEAVKHSRTILKGAPTHWMNRGVGELRVAAMSEDMARGVIRIPAATSDDRHRSDLFKTHFLAWDQDATLRQEGSKANRHLEYDIAMAAWVGWVLFKRQFVIESADEKVQPRAVSRQAQRSWGYTQKDTTPRAPVPTDLDALIYT